MSSIRELQLNIKFTSKEKDRFSQLWESLKNDCNISPKRQSEIIIEGFFQYAEQLLSSYIPHTHTNSQSLTKQRKEAIFSLLEEIKKKGYMFFMQTYAELITSKECFQDVKVRTKSNYFQSFLQSEDLFLINISNYYDTQTRAPIVILHRESKWFAQLKSLCFSVSQPVFKLTHDQMSEAKMRDAILQRIQRKSHYKSSLDFAEKTMFNAFLYEIGELEEQPIYDNSNLDLREVIQLRSELRFTEAEDFIREIRNKKALPVHDKGMQFLEALGK